MGIPRSFALAALLPGALAPAQCVPGWTMLGPGGPDGNVDALLVFDDGSGPALIAAGDFAGAALGSPNVARLRPGGPGARHWEGMGGGRQVELLTLAAHDDGSGRRLYAGGFSAFPGSTLSRWTGTAWEWVDAPASWIGVIASWTPPGLAPQLYASGTVFPPDPPSDGYLGRLVGGQWHAAGGGFDTVAWGFLEFDDGRGRSLFAAGNFSQSNGVALNGVGRWDGTSWSALGSGLSGFDQGRALAVFDDGTGAALYVAGNFSGAGGVPAERVARWDGQHWSPVGEGRSSEVRALAVFDDGHGPGLVAAGNHLTPSGQPATAVLMWRRGAWEALGAGLDGDVNALALFDPDGPGPESPWLVAGGSFGHAGGLSVPFVAAYHGCACPANCDASTVAPVLNVADFTCFLRKFGAGDPGANCDGSTAAPVLNVADFACFLQRFAAGCP